jgi:hypothetical protein
MVSSFQDIIKHIVKDLLERFAKKELHISPEKSVWPKKNIEFLGYSITVNRMRMANDKTEPIEAWQTP